MERQLDHTPLELLAQAALRPSIERDTQRKLLDSYDRFLGILDNEEKRRALERMTEPELSSSEIWREIHEISHDFHSGLVELFFGNDEEFRTLITQYGVF
jgi:hypothetical protein